MFWIICMAGSLSYLIRLNCITAYILNWTKMHVILENSLIWYWSSVHILILQDLGRYDLLQMWMLYMVKGQTPWDLARLLLAANRQKHVKRKNISCLLQLRMILKPWKQWLLPTWRDQESYGVLGNLPSKLIKCGHLLHWLIFS